MLILWTWENSRASGTEKTGLDEVLRPGKLGRSVLRPYTEFGVGRAGVIGITSLGGEDHAMLIGIGASR